MVFSIVLMGKGSYLLFRLQTLARKILRAFAVRGLRCGFKYIKLMVS